MVGHSAIEGRVRLVVLTLAISALAAYSQQGQQTPPPASPDASRTPLSTATPKRSLSNVPLEFQSHGLDYEALTKDGITVMFAVLPQQLKEFHILQVTITNGSPVSWTVRPTDFSFTRQDGVVMPALTADEVVSSLLDKASRNDVIKLQMLYENTIYALANYRPTNGYEQRRQAAMAQFVNMRFSAAAAASAVALAALKLQAGDSTDGAIFFINHPKEKSLGTGLLIAHTCDQTFTFQTRGRAQAPVTDPTSPGQLSTEKPAAYVDLHSHTDASDGSLSPQELVQQALRIGLRALAITDHDTFAGFEEAEPYARNAGLDLVRGIELNSRLEWPPIGVRSVHVLAYFLKGKPAQPFLDWLEEQRLDRRDRNCRLIQALQEKGVEITIEEVERVGRSLTGRPHFARILVAKGYASDTEDAFRRYIGESAPAYVERQSPSPAAVISAIRSAGGVPVVAHPVRLDLDRATERAVLLKLKEAGLLGLEVQHSDQGPQLQTHYARLAADLLLTPTGGSTFTVAPSPTSGSALGEEIMSMYRYLFSLRFET